MVENHNHSRLESMKDISDEKSSRRFTAYGVDSSKVLPGTMFPPPGQRPAAHEGDELILSPRALSGPKVNGMPTTIILYNPHQLAEAACLPSIRCMINAAFSASHQHSGVIPTTIQRLQTTTQLVEELNRDSANTFTYVIIYTGTNQALGTASGKRWVGTPKQPKHPAETIFDESKTFKRYGMQKEGVEEWELSLMAIDPILQRQGLARLLMKLVNEEVLRRHVDNNLECVVKGEAKKSLVMLLSTVKEINGEFYARRGYVVDYESRFPTGWLGSLTGFGVLHMSRQADV